MRAAHLSQWFLTCIAVIALLLAAGATYVYVQSERYLTRVQRGPEFTAPIPRDETSIEHGKHIARTRGCFGCHGQQLEGQVFAEEWIWVDTAVAPNLARYAKQHEPSVIEAAVRQGIGHDGRALWSMPSYNFANLNDADMAALIAYLQGSPLVEKALATARLGWAARWRIVRGEAQHMAEWADRMPRLQARSDEDTQLARGEYIAMTTCNECHGFDLRGQVDIDQSTPDLSILAAYSDQDFRRLMQHGEGIGGRSDLGLMTMVAKDRFAHFTEQELIDLLAYLRTLPGRPIDRDAAWRQLR